MQVRHELVASFYEGLASLKKFPSIFTFKGLFRGCFGFVKTISRVNRNLLFTENNGSERELLQDCNYSTKKLKLRRVLESLCGALNDVHALGWEVNGFG